MKERIEQEYFPLNWKMLYYCNIYRIALSVLLLYLGYFRYLPGFVAETNVALFVQVCCVYFVCAIACILPLYCQYPKFNIQVTCYTCIDLILISLMIHISGSLGDFSMLMVMIVTMDSLMRPGKLSILFAALAAISVLTHELIGQFFYLREPVYSHAGFLGLVCFVTAVISNILPKKTKVTQDIAARQAEELDELEKLNEHIVQQIRSGIVVIKKDLTILLANQSARQMLHQSGTGNDQIVDFVKRYLAPLINDCDIQAQQTIVIKPDEGDELRVSLSVLHNSGHILVVFDDMRQIRQRVHQARLALLGRLGAGIAHEIRNPLGAINHAGQLLAESDTLNSEEYNLAEIINLHSLRINRIIENILNISRAQKSTEETLAVIPWLKKLIAELVVRFRLEEGDIELLNRQKDNLTVRIDPSNLYQIIWNLSENGLRYSQGHPLLTFHFGMDPVYPYIDIQDYGQGIPKDVQEKLFEPFFTTESEGSGLGLYLAKELAEANDLSLSLLSSCSRGTIFRLRFLPSSETKNLV